MLPITFWSRTAPAVALLLTTLTPMTTTAAETAAEEWERRADSVSLGIAVVVFRLREAIDSAID